MLFSPPSQKEEKILQWRICKKTTDHTTPTKNDVSDHILILYKKSNLAKIFKFKNKKLFAFGENAKTLPSVETLMKKSKKRGSKPVPVTVLKTFQKIKTCRKQTPWRRYGFSKKFLSSREILRV